MSLFIYLSLLISLSIAISSKYKFKNEGYSSSLSNESQCFWNRTIGRTLPYQSVAVECCDEKLRSVMLEAVALGHQMPKLGDLAKYMQRRAQLEFHVPFETIISKHNFAISSHYHGTHSCKIADGRFYFLLYETPGRYDPFDLRNEDFFSSLDSSEPLGSTKPANVRGDFPDLREDPTAGEDLSIQPQIDHILQFPNKFALPDPKEKVLKEIELAEQNAARLEAELLESVTEISILNSENATNYVNVTEVELPNPKPIPRNFANLREKDRLPEDTHCDKTRKDGNRCCDGRLASTMRDAMRQMSTSPDFHAGEEGLIAAELQQKVQQRFKKSFEVIVSKSDFIISSYAGGDSFCKYQNKGFYILAYATSKQYDIDEKEDEVKLSRTSSRDPLGTNKTMFENEAPWHIKLALEMSGERAGYPVGSHCSEKRTGSRCCSLILFNAMQSAYERHIADSKFDPYDIRNISNAIQWNVEEVLQFSAEVIVSLDDFVIATHHENIYTCKYRVDKYYILAYTTPVNDAYDEYDENKLSQILSEPDAELVQPVATYPPQQYPIPLQNTFAIYQTTPMSVPSQMWPVQQQPNFFGAQGGIDNINRAYPQMPQQYQQYQPQYHNPMIGQNYIPTRSKRQIGASPFPIHQSPYNDIGSAKPFNCPADLTGLSGMACCDGGLQYEASKTIDQAKQAPDFDKHNTRNLAKLMTRAVQKRFGTTFESVVAEADFSWGTNKFNQRTCKIDSDGYSALTYQSSSKAPPASDFLDIPNDPTLGGPTGSSGNGGGGAGGSGSNAGGGGTGGGGDGGGGTGGAGNGGAGNGGAGNGGAGNGGAGNGGAGNGGAGQGGAGQGGAGQGGAGDAGGGVAAAQAQAVAEAQAQAFAAAQAAAADAAQSQAAAAGAAAAQAESARLASLAAAGAGAGACFSVDTWVTTPTGKKRMDQIEVGDYVLSSSLDSNFFTPVTLWIHREPETIEDFVTIMTEYGKMLRLTARHFMFRNKCGNKYDQYIKRLPLNSAAIYASDLEVGDCVIVLYKGKYRQQKIQEITTTRRKGIYSPLTANGRIIVNDMLASCYSEMKQSTLQTTFFWAANLFRNKVVKFFGDLAHNRVELPSITTLTKDMMFLIIPSGK